MPSSKDSPNRNEVFGRLLSGAINSIATYEGKTAPIIEEELGALAIVAGKTIQRYKAGHLPPEHETVKVLAEAAVRRGFLDREWLERFLHAARYPFAAKLLDQLRPISMVKTRPPRSYENLPAPTYNQFVPRAQAFAEVLDGLQQRSAVVLIVGMGGNGKTSLAREVADACIKGHNEAPQFDAAVWISDKDRSGTTNLSIVLDEIARTLDYPGFTQFEHEEKRREVEQILKRQRVLIIVDNFETITDGSLLTWLLRVPEPSKTIITSREYSRAFRNSTIVTDLRGLRGAEAQEFITQRLRVLRIVQMVNDQAQLEPLLAATGGNPKAIEMTLGLMKYERRPIQQVVDDLYAARGELFDDLFTRAWALLDEAARRMLLVMTFFPTSASSEALSATADVQGFAFDRAVERLTDLALIDVQQEDLISAPRYELHPLVRAFAESRITEALEFERAARTRWVDWYVRLASRVGVCWDDLNRLIILDPEKVTIFRVLLWVFERSDYNRSIQLSQGIRFYYSVRGLWETRLSVNLMQAKAAAQLSDPVQEMRALTTLVEAFCKQGDVENASIYIPRMRVILESPSISNDGRYDYYYAMAMYHLARQDFNAAQYTLEQALELSHGLDGSAFVLNLRWLGVCHYHKGEHDSSKRIFEESIRGAKK